MCFLLEFFEHALTVVYCVLFLSFQKMQYPVIDIKDVWNIDENWNFELVT
jgi:hypothetical protein